MLDIGMLGPSRVGKTSLVTSLLIDGRRLLVGTPGQLEPDVFTNNRVQKQREDMQGALVTGRFNPGALKGGVEVVEFGLDLVVKSARLPMRIHDYPGAWLTNPEDVPPEKQSSWWDCVGKLHRSSVLLIPIDTAVLMEPFKDEHRYAIPRILGIPSIEDVVQQWVSFTLQDGGPSNGDFPTRLLVFVPLKCESYFRDNGGRQDRSAALLDAVRKYYQPVLETVRSAPHGSQIRVLYAPVDTYGCVDLMSPKWKGVEGQLEFSADYRVRRETQRSIKPYGIDNLLAALCEHAMRLEVLRLEACLAEDERQHTQIKTKLDVKMLRLLWQKVTGERAQLSRLLEGVRDATGEHTQDRNALLDLVARLAGHKMSSRARYLLVDGS